MANILEMLVEGEARWQSGRDLMSSPEGLEWVLCHSEPPEELIKAARERIWANLGRVS